ncbi:DNA gyrase inhibitor [Dickeya solani]|nr:GyrI-like domain-containing protein [Dickeya solani]NUA45261.1 DNA gyrase inhibitor [Dickeya solani]NUA47146.1 DNA gyrase inhibitor [Dickeya solani]QKO12638.1 DNA gyrase inhibitor [Dickeya solani]
MTLRFDVAQPKKVHCLRVIGPYHQSVPDGFQKLIAWSQEQPLPWTETLAFYWDDPSETQQDQLRADVALVFPEGTAIGENTLGVREETVPGDYSPCFIPLSATVNLPKPGANCMT